MDVKHRVFSYLPGHLDEVFGEQPAKAHPRLEAVAQVIRVDGDPLAVVSSQHRHEHMSICGSALFQYETMREIAHLCVSTKPGVIHLFWQSITSTPGAGAMSSSMRVMLLPSMSTSALYTRASLLPCTQVAIVPPLSRYFVMVVEWEQLTWRSRVCAALAAIIY